MTKVKAQSQVKKKKKIWVQINAPKMFGNKKIGETYVFASENALGKTVEQNLMTLTGEMKKQNITIKFIIDKVTGSVASTKIVSYKMAPSFIKRLVRRRRDKMDFSKVFTTKDRVKVRIKSLIISTSRSRGSTQTAIINKAQTLVASYVSKISFDTLVEEIISYKMQIFLKNNLKNIHPLRNCEIREFKIEKDKKKGDVEIEDATEEEQEEPVKEKEAPKVEEEPKVEEKTAEEKKEEPKVEEPVAEESPKEEVKPEEKVEEVKEEPKVEEETPKEEPKPEEKVEEVKEYPKVEEKPVKEKKTSKKAEEDK